MKRKLFFLIFSITFFCSFVCASHLSGNELTYEHLGGCSYRIHFTRYFDCDGAATSSYLPINTNNPYPPQTVSFAGPSGCIVGAIPLNWVLEAYEEASPICLGMQTACMGNSTPLISGEIRISYYADINLCNLGCSAVKISISDCCRNYAITSGLDGTGIYNEMIIPLTTFPNNSSPMFISPPCFDVLAGQPLNISQAAFDPDGDSLAYHLDSVMQSSGVSCVYGLGYSSLNPLGTTWAVTINPTTGMMHFQPSPTGAMVVSVIRVRVDEYRNNVKIGSVSREMQVTVIPANTTYTNALPNISITNLTGAGLGTTSRTLTGNANYPIEFDILVADSDLGQMLGLTSNLAILFPNASITHINGINPSYYHFSWTPLPADMGKTLPLWLDAADNYCSVSLHSKLFYNVHINTLSITANISNTPCGVASGAIDLAVNGGLSPFTFSWSNGATTEDINNVPMGAYQVLITEANGVTWFSDTFYINAGAMSANITQTIPACGSNTGVLRAYPAGGIAPYTCSWSNGQVGDSIINLPAGGYSVNITDFNGCFLHKVSVLNSAPNCYATIKGRVFNDANHNCIQDLGEAGFPNQFVKLQNYNYVVLTDSLGNYSFVVYATGNYVIEYIPNYTLQNLIIFSCMPAPYVQNAYVTSLGASIVNVNYAVHLAEDRVVNYVETIYRSGFLHSTNISCKNFSAIVDTALLVYKYDNVLHNLSFSPPPISHNPVSRIVKWHLNNFSAGTNQIFTVTSSVLATATIGDTAKSYVNLISTLDSFPTNNQDTVFRIIVGSYDPNVKEVSPQGETAAGFIPPTTSQLEYTIHFQNTGNYPASFVTVRDTIDTNAFDIYSLEMQMCSHPCTVTIENEQVIVFSFENINLPDSTSDEPNSHGFVKFGLNLKPSLPLNTEIANNAAIYFDFNAPIITNSTLNTLHIPPQDTTINDTTANDTTNTTSANANAFFAHKVKVYPNPFSEITTLSFPNAENEEYSLIIRDLTGKVVQKIEYIRGSEVKIAKENKAKGVYLWELKGKYSARGKLMLE